MAKEPTTKNDTSFNLPTAEVKDNKLIFAIDLEPGVIIEETKKGNKNAFLSRTGGFYATKIQTADGKHEFNLKLSVYKPI